MKKLFIFFFLSVSSITIFSQANSFYINLKEKELATFNDAITLIRLVFDEKDETKNFILNALWAAEKKLFKVSIPIDPKAVNPVISRKEFAYWLCGISEVGGKSIPTTRLDAYKRLVRVGVIHTGRGPEDSFSGIELLDTFTYYDYYIRSNKIKLRFNNLPLFEDEYDGVPEWRVKLYNELDEQRKYEKKMKQERKDNKKKLNENGEEIIDTKDAPVNEKIVE